jgi:hypothetical protein
LKNNPPRESLSAKIPCAEDHCTACEDIVVRVYDELRQSGYGDRDAFQSAIHVLKLRHPGHDADYYRERASRWIDAHSLELHGA